MRSMRIPERKSRARKWFSDPGMRRIPSPERLRTRRLKERARSRLLFEG